MIACTKLFNLPHSRGVFMRDNLSKKVKKYEVVLIVNLDSINGLETYWTACRKNDLIVIYFHSFVNLPPAELVKYFNSIVSFKIPYIYQ